MDAKVYLTQKIVKLSLGFVGLISVGLITYILAIAYWVSPDYGSLVFNQQGWLSDDKEFDCQGAKMLKNIQRHVLSSQISEADVISLLGSSFYREHQTINYGIGYCGSGVDYTVFRIQFDASGYYLSSKIDET